MKKTMFKKSISLMLTVLMIMSCWVWVAPNHAHAAGVPIIELNTAAANSVANLNTTVTTIHGKFESDSDYLDSQYYDAIYHNVLYTDGPTTIAASATSAKTEYENSWTGSNGVTVYWYHPTATLLYDGDTTNLPRLGVAVNTVMYYTGTWSRKTVNRLSWVYSGGNGFNFNQNWKGSDGRLNFNYMWHGQSELMGYTSTIVNEGMRQTLSGNSDNHFYANLLKFTDTMGTSEYYRSATPTFGFYGDNGSKGKTITATSTDTIYIINYVPLRTAIQDAMLKLQEIKDYPGKYTIESVAKFVAAANALIAAKPNNYINSTVNDVTGWASAAETAVNNYNKVNLELATYDVTYENMFSFSDWANSASSVIGTPAKGTMTYDVNAGTITVNNNGANTQDYPNDHYTSYGFGNGHYNMTLVPGETYTFEYTTSGGTGDQVHIFFYDNSGNTVANPANRGNPFANAYGSGNGKSTISFTAPQNATKAAFRFGSTVLGETVTFSDIVLYSHTRGDYADIAGWSTRPVRKYFTYNTPLGTTLDVPVRTGYTFNGWWVDSINPNGQKDAGEQVTDANGNVVDTLKGFGIAQHWNLYSEWTENTYNIAFDANDGNGSMSTLNGIKYTASQVLTSNAFTRTNYIFKGWNTAADGSGTAIADGATVSKLSATNGATVTLYAQWELNQCTITFKFADGTTQYVLCNMGETPTAPENTAAYNDATGHYSYTWPEIVVADGDKTYEETENIKDHDFSGAVKANGDYTHSYQCTECEYYGPSVSCSAYYGAYINVTGGEYGTHKQQCSVCQQYSAESAHTWDNGYVSKNPSCSEMGEMTYTCTATDCGATKTSPLDKAAHTWTEKSGVVKTAGTCTAEAVYYYGCADCDAIANDDVANGTYTGEKDATNHTGEANVVKGNKAKTCTTDGYTGDTHWSCCDAIAVKGQTIPAGHEWGEWLQYQSGSTHRRTCSVCNTYEEGNHNYNTDAKPVVMPGSTAHYHNYKCTLCEARGIMNGSTPMQNIGTACYQGSEATYANNDESNHTVTCVCGNTKTEGHWWTVTDSKAATCTEDGYKKSKCDYCSATKTETIPAGHAAGIAAEEDRIEATCTTDGSYNLVVRCTVCNEKISSEPKTITAGGHTFGATVDAKPATCIKTGNEAYKTCTVCNKFFAADAEIMSTDAKDNADEFAIKIDSTNHTNTTEYVETSATCLDKGYAVGTYCDDCDTWISGHEEIPAIAHKNKAHHEKIPATCANVGTIEYWSCPDCKKNFSDEACTTEATNLTLEIDPDNHDLKTTEKKDPTCTEIGWDAYETCTRCKYSTYVEKPMLDHTAGEVMTENVTAPTCGTDGSHDEVVYCTACNFEISRETIVDTATGNHSWSDTYTSNGDGIDATHYQTCTVCSAENTAEAHTWGEGVITTEPTCSAEGTKTYTCQANGCGATYTETVEKSDHNYEVTVTARPVKNADGTWTKGTYTKTCKNDSTHTVTEDAERADYSAFDKAVEALTELLTNEKLTDEGKTAINEVLAKADALAENLVTIEQSQIDELVSELNETKAAAEYIIENAGKPQPIVNATSGLKVQFLKETGIGTIESLQLKAGGGFDPARLRLINNNSTLPITVVSVVADKAEIESAANVVIAKDGSIDLSITAPDTFNETGIITYTITYKIGDETGYLMTAEGTPVVLQTEAYIYVKGAAFTPYHAMDEKTLLNGTSKWNHYVEATNYGDFGLISYNTASKFSDKLETGTKWYSLGNAHTTYDFDEDGCQAGCKNNGYGTGDGHAATYSYFVDTSLAPTWEKAGFRLRIVETANSVYENAPLKSIRVANDQAFIDGIKGDDKTFTLTFLPSASSNAPNASWAITSTGTLDVASYANPNENEWLFGEHKNKDTFDENTVYANLTGEIPSGVTEAKFMLSPRLEFNGTALSESVTMTTHIWLTSYDKGDLRVAVNAAEQAAYNPNYFTADSFNGYLTALEAAKEILGKAETTQSEVDNATTALEDAVNDLERAEYVLTVTHSIHEKADKNAEATSTEYSYYLIAKNGSVTPALKTFGTDIINKYDDAVTLTITDTTEHTYNYWYIDYSEVDVALDAAQEIIDNKDQYSSKYIEDVTKAKEALEAVKNTKDTTTAPESQSVVADAVKAVTDLIVHDCNEAVEIPAVPATCTATGLTAGARCSVCGKITKAQEIAPMLAHTEAIDAAVAPTCTETGLTEGIHCSVCNKVLVAQEEVPANGHDYGEWIKEVAATCEKPGTKGHYECSVCHVNFDTDKTTVIDDLTLAQLDHSYTGEYKWNNATETKTHSQKCVNGCEEYGNETECTFDTVVTDPDCFNGGYTTYTCKVCNNSYQGDNTAKREHKFVYATGDGTSHTVTCEYNNCNYEETENCSGGTAYCNAPAVCEKCYTNWGEKNPANHTGGTRVEKEDAVAGTCIAEETWNDVTYCEGCNAELNSEANTGAKDPANHTSEETYVENEKAATCTVPGYTGDTYHKCCDALKEKGEAIVAKGHAFGDWKANGNDTHSRECTVCKDEADRVETEYCEYGEWTVINAPKCTEKGQKSHTCTVCNNTVTEDIQALDHIDEDSNGYCDRDGCGELICDHVGQKTVLKDDKKETCLEDGYTGDKHCAKCDVIVEYGIKIDKLGHKDENKDHACDNGCDVYQGTHADNNSDHNCDYGCGESIGTHADSADDKDHVCDYGCGAVLEECVDSNKDHACDNGCDKFFGDCEDKDYDHDCDYGCDKYFGTHADSADDADHVCDYGCGAELEECVDDDKDHACDNGCDKVFGDCEDNDYDHACDYGCDKFFGDCGDADKDHNCDYGCDKVFGDCEDKDYDHDCDYGCDKSFGDCEDNDYDHACDYGCDKVFGDCEDNDYDHDCDYGCDKSFGTCEDKDSDHDCDYGCDKYFGTCEDNDYDHACDYGCDKVFGDCEDNDYDHDCDYGCDKYFGTCEDNDSDHDCDYGCDKYFGTCEDKDYDHDCDYGCDKSFGDCEDKDSDHDCDYGCDKYFGTHADSAEDADHVCDYGCGAVLEECVDSNKDHVCDNGCDKYFGTHADSADDADHICDYGCGAVLEECVDNDKDHACDNGCDKVFGTCEDNDSDHDCDYGCDKVYGTCEDKDYDHACDYGCDKYFGTCEDNDSDHDCDYGCDKYFGTCEDKDYDHDCDYGCDKSFGDCEDKDYDHDCDYGCDKSFGTCEDNDSDHDCDYGCDKYFGTHADSADDKDHVCDYGCGAVLEECVDGDDKNHNCDICDKESISEHEWKEADCTTPKTCSVCGATEGSELGHDYDKTKSEDNLTRPELVDGNWTQGYYTYTCKNNSDHTTTEKVDRASYTAYETALDNLKSLLDTDITNEARVAINKAIDDNKVAENLIATEQGTVDTAEANLKAAFEQYKGSLKTYTVTFVIDGKETKVTVISGQSPTAPTDVKKAYDDTHHYKFTGWDKPYTNITSDLVVTAQFENIEHIFNEHTDKDDEYHTDKCDCGYSKEVKHTETSAVTTKASCYADGVRTYTCTVCGGTRTETIAKREHNIVDSAVAVAPTCSATGTMNQKCNHTGSDEYEACTYTTTRVMDKVANAHKWETEYTVDKKASCDEAGSKSYHCEYCDTIDATSVVEIAKREHNLVDTTVALAPTCSATGTMNQKCDCAASDEYEACTYTTTRVMDKVADAHKWETEYTVDKKASCDEAGSKSYHCEYCDTIDTTSVVEIAKREHNIVDSAVALAPTCSATGTMNQKCDYAASDEYEACTYTTTRVMDKVADAHKWETEYTVDKKASCDAAGSKSYHCEYCDTINTDSEVEIAKREHSLVDTAVALAPTCSATGIMNQKCDHTGSDEYEACTYTTTRVIEIDADAHKWETEYTVDKKASCDEAGSKSYHCEYCDTINTDSVVEIAKREHNLVDTTVALAPTCSATGTMNQKCDHTGSDEYEACTYTTTRVMDKVADAHTGEANVIKNKKDATCTEKGYTGDIYWSCCDALKEKGSEIGMIDHSDADGDNNHSCDACGKEDVTAHTYIDATCDNPATCSECGSFSGGPLGHNYTEFVKTVPYTCTEKGYDIYKCSRCDATEKQNYTDAAHTIKQVEAKAPTCTQAGYEAYEYCTACDEYTTYKEIPATDHSYKTTIVPATCTETGTKTVECTVCGDGYTEILPATGHTVKERKYITATCTRDGSSYAICADCGAEYDHKTHEKMGHNYSDSPEFIVITEATCEASGASYRKCVRCGELENVAYKTYPAKGHYYFTYNDAVAPTCTTDGMTEAKRCLDCGIEIKAEIIPALGHKNDGNGQCVHCDSLIEEDGYVCTCMCHKTSFIHRIIYKIIRFFWKIFKINKTCKCDAIHY